MRQQILKDSLAKLDTERDQLQALAEDERASPVARATARYLMMCRSADIGHLIEMIALEPS